MRANPKTAWSTGNLKELAIIPVEEAVGAPVHLVWRSSKRACQHDWLARFCFSDRWSLVQDEAHFGARVLLAGTATDCLARSLGGSTAAPRGGPSTPYSVGWHAGGLSYLTCCRSNPGSGMCVPEHLQLRVRPGNRTTWSISTARRCAVRHLRLSCWVHHRRQSDSSSRYREH